MFNITKEIIIFSSQRCHVTDRVTRTRTNYFLEILTSNVAEGLVTSNEKGREQTKYFVH